MEPWMVQFLGAAFGMMIAVIIAKIAGWSWKNRNKTIAQVTKPPMSQINPVVQMNLGPLEDLIKGLPTKVLQSIQSSANTKKGALGELIGYIELEAEYDRIIPLGNIVDFMCIKFPDSSRTGKDNEGVIDMGRVDFVDVKTGRSSRLSKDQRELQKLIKDKRVNFVKVKVETQTSESKSTTS